MSESRAKQRSIQDESQKPEKETDPYWWSVGGQPSKKTMDRYKDAKPQRGSTTLPIDVNALEEMFPLQEVNDGTERVFREFSSPEEARLFSKSYRAASKADSKEFIDKINGLSASALEKKSDSSFAREAYTADQYWKGVLLEGGTPTASVGEDFPLDEKYLVLSRSWKPNQ